MFTQRRPSGQQTGNNLLRITMMIVFGLANLNNGLTSYVTQDNINNELHRNINQNLIMSPASAGISGPIVTSNYNVPAPQSPPLPAATGHGSFHGSYSAAFTASSDMPYPPSSISASSSYHHQHQLQQQQQRQQQQQHQQQSQQLNLQQPYHQTSGSSITSFDSANVIDERHQQRHSHQHQQLQHIARPLHKVVGVGGGGGGEHNSLGEAAQGSSAEVSNAGLDEIYAAPMYFGTENSTVVTTQIGATAHIPCTVHHIGDGVVSWIRKKDYHLLTVGLTTYSSDERFSATHLKHSEDWTLQIKFVQLRDAGVYECQVSTHPPTSIFLHLNVVEARAEISGPPIRYLTPGSTLRLQCRVVQNTEASEFIFWYHDNRMINYDSDRGINVSTDPDFQSSELTIQRTRREHSGNFTCVASNTQPASVLVHIFKGDNPAAMYHGHVGGSTKSYQTHLHGITAIIAMAYRILQTYVHVNLG